MRHRTAAPMVIGLTHLDCVGAWTAENTAIALGYGHPSPQRPPIIDVNPTEQSSVASAIMAVMEHFVHSSIPRG